MTSSAVRAPKKRQLKGTETDIMHEMLFSKTKSPIASSPSNDQFVRHEPRPDDSITDSNRVEARKHVPSARGNAVDLSISDTKRRKSGAGDSDDESVGSADTYTIESDGGKDELRGERARIDVEFGVVPDSAAADDDRPSSTAGSAHLQARDDDDCPPLQIHEEDLDEPAQPRLKRTTVQTLFAKNVNDGASLGGVSHSDAPADVEELANVDRSPDDSPHALAAVGRNIPAAMKQETRTTKRASCESTLKRLHLENEADIASTGDDSLSNAAGTTVTVIAEHTTQNSTDTSTRDGDDDDDFDEDDRSHPAAVLRLKATENAEVSIKLADHNML